MADGFVISGWMDFGVHRDDVLAAFLDCARLSRGETGCRDYWVAPDPDDTGRIYVFECWATEADLAEHFRTPHIARFREAVSGYPRQGRALRRYFVERSEDFESSRVS